MILALAFASAACNSGIGGSYKGEGAIDLTSEANTDFGQPLAAEMKVDGDKVVLKFVHENNFWGLDCSGTAEKHDSNLTVPAPKCAFQDTTEKCYPSAKFGPIEIANESGKVRVSMDVKHGAKDEANCYPEHLNFPTMRYRAEFKK